MTKLTNKQIESLFYEHLANAIDANFELGPGKVINKEGSIGIGRGLCLTVHSDDHDTHFHIQHRGRNINARFSFPDIEFVGYKSIGNNPFSSRELKNVITTCDAYREFISEQLKKR